MIVFCAGFSWSVVMRLKFRRLVSKSLVRSSGEVGLQQILAGNVITCLETLINCQCCFNLVLGLQLHLKEIFFFGLGVTVTEINIKKVQKQDLKNIKNVKGCRDGRHAKKYANKVGMI